MSEALKPLWRSILKFNWKLGLLLILIICIPRFYLVLRANETGTYGAIGIIMLISAILPFVLLTKKGRQMAGIQKTNRWLTLLFALIAGLFYSLIVYLIGFGLYDHTMQNWYSYIGLSYNIPEGIAGEAKMYLFLVTAITGMIFSPIGEEFFFRGIVHQSLAIDVGQFRASVIDALSFALVHLSHFGIVYVNSSWTFYPLPALLWVILMFLAGMLFVEMKKRASSIWGAVLCHAGFNLGMVYCIFYL